MLRPVLERRRRRESACPSPGRPPPGPGGRIHASVYRIKVYCPGMAIRGFASPKVELFFREGRLPRAVGWVAVARVVARKLDMLDYAVALSDLASPPGNRLETLRGDLAGFHSVRINDQWRIVFRWTVSGPIEVDVRDYH